VERLQQFREVGVERGFAVERDGDVAGFHRLLEAFPGDFVVAAEPGEQFLLEFDGGVHHRLRVVPLHAVEFVRVAGMVPPAEHAALVAPNNWCHLDAAVGANTVEGVLVAGALPRSAFAVHPQVWAAVWFSWW